MKSLFLIAVLVLAACTLPAINTPSGKPEINVAKPYDIKAVRNNIVGSFVDSGYNIQRADDYNIVAGRMISNPFGGDFESRITATLVENPENLRIIFGKQTVRGLHADDDYPRFSDRVKSELYKRFKVMLTP